MSLNRSHKGEQKRRTHARKDSGHVVSGIQQSQKLMGLLDSSHPDGADRQIDPQPGRQRGKDIGDEIDLWL